MPNQTYALEWLDLAGKNLNTAELLHKQDHYSDIIAIEIHQTIEKTFKSVLAFKGVRIPKTHDLLYLYELCEKDIDISDALIDDLLTINDYYESERYPGPRYTMPDKAEIELNLSVAKSLHEKARYFISST